MILDCPKCSARFLVADRLIPHDGRTVRCGACSHQWHVMPAIQLTVPSDVETVPIAAPPIEEPLPEIKPIPKGSNVPAITKRKLPVKPFIIAAPVLLALWVILAFFTYFPKGVDAPVFRSLYSVFGVANTQGLVFADVHMEREDTETKTKFIFTGSIQNHAAVERTVPLVRIALKDKGGSIIWVRKYPVNVQLKAGEVYPFRIVDVQTSFAQNVATIVLDLGNSLELMVR